jgi:hypothetical protein
VIDIILKKPSRKQLLLSRHASSARKYGNTLRKWNGTIAFKIEKLQSELRTSVDPQPTEGFPRSEQLDH